VRLSGWYGDEEVALAGTLLGDCHPRLVKINQYEIEVVPEGTLLITEHSNQPGVIAALSTILANADVNISSMQVGCCDVGSVAMAVIGISTPLNEELLVAIENIQNVHKVTQITL
jgi:D-3-phosphoglycerate dehydrogenase